MYEELFDQGVERRGTDCVKWDLFLSSSPREDAISLGVADMDFATPACVTDAIIKRAAHGAFGYTVECPEDKQAVVDWMRERHGLTVEKDWILFSPGVINSMRQTLGVLTRPGDSVVIQPPVYGPFSSTVLASGCSIRKNCLLHDESGWHMDLDDLEKAFREGARVLMICNPHNPVGRVWSREELTAMAQVCKRYGVTVISDEIHSDLEMPGYHNTSMLLVDPDAVVFISATKTFNLAALSNSSILVANEKTRKALKERYANLYCGGLNLFGQIAQRAAYRGGAGWLDELRVYLDENRRYVEARLAADFPRITCSRLQGTYLMWLDMRALGLEHEQLVQLCKDAGFGAVSGTAFGEEGKGFMRVNIATPRKNLAAAFDLLKKAVAAL